MFAVNASPPVSIMLVLVLLIALTWVWYGKQGPDRSRFGALLLLWAGACLPHTIGANFQSRYLYFPGIFAALVLADILGTLRLRLYARKFVWLFISLVIVGYLATDLYAFRRSIKYYMEATRIYDAGIQKIRSNLPEKPDGLRLVLVDFPDGISRPRTTRQGHQDGYRILIFRNAFPWHLWLLYQNSNLKVTLLRLSDPNGDDNPEPLGTPTNPGQLTKLLAAPQTMAWRYLPEKPESFVLIKNSKP
ncbi:MAG: hypothetical protein ACYC6G_07555 [Desulfobaccales bacterium]